jgi:hypothetical protein
MDVTLRFPYQDEYFTGSPPPSRPFGVRIYKRPLIPVTIHGPNGSLIYDRALVDTGADDTVFPIDTARYLGIPLHPHLGHGIRWRGQMHAMRFGDAEFEIMAGGIVWRWPAVIGFSPAPIRYPILGQAGFLQFMDARFLGADFAVELEVNHTYPGTQA